MSVCVCVFVFSFVCLFIMTAVNYKGCIMLGHLGIHPGGSRDAHHESEP